MRTWYRVQGDVNDTLVAQLDGVVDLSAVASGEAHVSQCDNGVVDLPLTVTNAVTRIVTVDLAAWLPTAAPGSWDLEFELTFISGQILTWPARGTDRVVVRSALG